MCLGVALCATKASAKGPPQKADPVPSVPSRYTDSKQLVNGYRRKYCALIVSGYNGQLQGDMCVQ